MVTTISAQGRAIESFEALLYCMYIMGKVRKLWITGDCLAFPTPGGDKREIRHGVARWFAITGGFPEVGEARLKQVRRVYFWYDQGGKSKFFAWARLGQEAIVSGLRLSPSVIG